MSWSNPGVAGGKEQREEEVAAAEASHERARLRREAYEAQGGTPLHRLWHRLRGGARGEDDTSSPTS